MTATILDGKAMAGQIRVEIAERSRSEVLDQSHDRREAGAACDGQEPCIDEVNLGDVEGDGGVVSDHPFDIVEICVFDVFGKMDPGSFTAHVRNPTLRTISGPMSMHGRTASARPALAT